MKPCSPPRERRRSLVSRFKLSQRTVLGPAASQFVGIVDRVHRTDAAVLHIDGDYRDQLPVAKRKHAGKAVDHGGPVLEDVPQLVEHTPKEAADVIDAVKWIERRWYFPAAIGDQNGILTENAEQRRFVALREGFNEPRNQRRRERLRGRRRVTAAIERTTRAPSTAGRLLPICRECRRSYRRRNQTPHAAR